MSDTFSDASEAAPSKRSTTLWVAATGISQGWKFLLTIASTIILGRLLGPQDFGLVATIGPVVGFIDLIKDLGFSQALIQRERISPRQAHALFWTSAALTAVAGLALVAASPFIAQFFHEPRLVSLLLTAAISMQLSAMGAQAWAWLNRRLMFYDIAAIDVIQSTVGLLTSAFIALVTHSYWALVLGGLAATVAGTALSIVRSGWRPGAPVFDIGVQQMLRFGAGVSLSNVMNYLSRNADNLLIARFSGAAQLGYYDRAYKLMLFPVSQISWPLSRVLTPVLSRMVKAPEAYRDTYLSTVTMLLVGTQPALLVAVMNSTPLIVGLLGFKWGPSAPIFAWLGVAAVQQVGSTTIGWLYLSQGRARHYAVSGLVNSASTIASFLIGLPWGPVGVAAAYSVSDYAVRLPFSVWFVGRSGPVRGKDILGSMWPHFIACGGVILFSAAVRMAAPSPGLGALAVTSIAAYVVYLALICLHPAKRKLVIESATSAWMGVRRFIRAGGFQGKAT